MSVYSNNQLKRQAQNEAWTKIFNFIKPDSKILDIGCSSGQLGAALKKSKKVHIVGIDIDTADVELAQANLDGAQVGNIETGDFPEYENQFDYVIMADVIEHLVDPIGALKKVKKMLNEGGQLIFSIPNMANVTTRIELLKGSFMYKDFGLLDRTHLHFYDQTEVQRVFFEAGFKVIDTDCTLREIPDNLLAKELDEVGITLSERLKKVLSSPDAIIYQFIGVATPGTRGKSFHPKTTTPLDIISVEIDELNKQYTHEILLKDAEIVRLKEEIARLGADLNEIVNSKAWKAVVSSRRITSKLRRK